MLPSKRFSLALRLLAIALFHLAGSHTAYAVEIDEVWVPARNGGWKELDKEEMTKVRETGAYYPAHYIDGYTRRCLISFKEDGPALLHASGDILKVTVHRYDSTMPGGRGPLLFTQSYAPVQVLWRPKANVHYRLEAKGGNDEPSIGIETHARVLEDD